MAIPQVTALAPRPRAGRVAGFLLLLPAVLVWAVDLVVPSVATVWDSTRRIDLLGVRDNVSGRWEPGSRQLPEVRTSGGPPPSPVRR